MDGRFYLEAGWLVALKKARPKTSYLHELADIYARRDKPQPPGCTSYSPVTRSTAFLEAISFVNLYLEDIVASNI